jgi:hypothetical protein
MLICNLLPIAKILPVTLFRRLVLAFRKPPMTIIEVPKAACDSKFFSKSRHSGEIQPMRVKKAGTKI